MGGQETRQQQRNVDSDAPNIQQRQVPQEAVHRSVEFGLHKDGSQDADIAPHCDYIGKEADGKRMVCSGVFSVRPRKMNSMTVVPFPQAPGSIGHCEEL